MLDRAVGRLAAAVGSGGSTEASVDALLGAAATDPTGPPTPSAKPLGGVISAAR